MWQSPAHLWLFYHFCFQKAMLFSTLDVKAAEYACGILLPMGHIF